jgi:putative transposase
VKLWYTPSELAELALPEMPATKRNINALAAREGWDRFASLCRPREGKGGGLEYHVQLLPAAARVALIGAERGEDAALAIFAAPDARPGLPSPAMLQRDARIAILGAWRAFRRTAELKATTAIIYFVDLYNIGKIDAPKWVLDTIPRLSVRTLSAWLAKAKGGDIDALAVDRGAARRGKGLLDVYKDGEIRLTALGLTAHNPHLSADHIRTVLIDRFGEELQHGGRKHPFPTLRAFQGALKRWRAEHRDELLAITNPDAFKSTRRVSGSYQHKATALNAFWQIDASPVDALCTDGRHAVYVCIDYWSRRLIVLVTKTARSEAVGLLMRKALLAWGVPDLVKTDNGSDFVARWTKRLFAALEIETETSTPFSPEQKGAVERAIGTFQRDFCATLPGFVGHSVADRKVIESRKAFSARLGLDDARAFNVELTAAELQARADAWANDRYAHRAHGGLDGETPFSRAASWPHPVRRIEDEAALGVLLAPIAGGDGTRIVAKQGLKIEGSWYLSPDLMPGTRVLVRLDPADLGAVWCFDPDAETYLGTAICPELRGIDRATALAQVRAAQKRIIAEGTAPIRKAAAAFKPRDAADAIARQAAINAGKLVELPRRASPVSTPALDEAALVMPAKAGPTAREMTAKERDLAAEIEADLAGAPQPRPEPVRKLRSGPTPQQLYRRYRELTELLELGQAIAPEDTLWMVSFADSAAFRAMDAAYRDFGEAALR